MTAIDMLPRIVCVVGARPNFMKIAPIMRALCADDSGLRATLVHTGQHYDQAMKATFFDQLGIPEPDVDLGVGSGSHAVQTAAIMTAFEPLLENDPPAAVLVVGDVNSTIACALVAVKKDIPVIHVEAGLRSGDRSMPEEINRVLTDQISSILFTTEASAAGNLVREGISESSVVFVGNVMIDTLKYNLPRAKAASETLAEVAASFEGDYGLVTLHRPSNVDDPEVLSRLLNYLHGVADQLPLVFPIHPRTKAQIEKAGFEALLDHPRIVCLGPQAYLQMLGLMKDAKVVLTDSGGIQEETTALGVPCLTLRENTERPITVEQGTNTIVGTDTDVIDAALQEVLSGGGKTGRVPAMWDGQAAQRIVKHLRTWIAQQINN